MKLSLIITTYNSPEFLKLVLDSVRRQILLPDEVIIADDGSGEETRMVIDRERKTFPVTLLHVWQEDQGFRAAKSRNNGIKISTGDYIVFIDGDIILDRRFVHDHHFFARKNQFVQGRRVHLSEERTGEIVREMKVPSLNFFSRGVILNRIHLIHNGFFRDLYERKKKTRKGEGIISANIGVWKTDLLKVNGFNEEFVGWGREDSELGVRMMNAGVKIRFLKFAAIGIHLFHQEKRIFSEKAQDLLDKTIENKMTWCEHGLQDENE